MSVSANPPLTRPNSFLLPTVSELLFLLELQHSLREVVQFQHDLHWQSHDNLDFKELKSEIQRHGPPLHPHHIPVRSWYFHDEFRIQKVAFPKEQKQEPFRIVDFLRFGNLSLAEDQPSQEDMELRPFFTSLLGKWTDGKGTEEVSLQSVLQQPVAATSVFSQMQKDVEATVEQIGLFSKFSYFRFWEQLLKREISVLSNFFEQEQ